MTARELPIEDWFRLEGLDLPMPLAVLTPEHCATAVVEEGNRIVGVAIAMTVVHGDVWWIDPQYRKSPRVVVALLSQFFDMLRSRNLHAAFITAPGPEIAGLIEKMGGVPQGTLYLVPVPATVGV